MTDAAVCANVPKMENKNDVRIIYSIPECYDNAARLRTREEGYLEKAKGYEQSINRRLKYWILPYLVTPFMAASVFCLGLNDDTLPRFGALLLILATIVTVWNLHLIQGSRDFFANKGCRYLDHRIGNTQWSSLNGLGLSDQVQTDMTAWHQSRFEFDCISDRLEPNEGKLLSRVLFVEGIFALAGTTLWGFGDWFV